MGRHVSRIHRSRRARRLRRTRRGMGLGLVGASLLAGLTAPAWADSVTCGSMAIPVLQRINPETSTVDRHDLDARGRSTPSSATATRSTPARSYKAAWDPGNGVVGIHRLYKPGGADFRMLPARARRSTPSWRPATSTRAPGSTPRTRRRLGCVAVHTFVKGGRHRTAATSVAKAGARGPGLEGPRAELLGRRPRPGDRAVRARLDPADDATPDADLDRDLRDRTGTTTSTPTTTITDPTATTTTWVPDDHDDAPDHDVHDEHDHDHDDEHDHHHDPTTTTTTTVADHHRRRRTTTTTTTTAAPTRHPRPAASASR